MQDNKQELTWRSFDQQGYKLYAKTSEIITNEYAFGPFTTKSDISADNLKPNNTYKHETKKTTKYIVKNGNFSLEDKDLSKLLNKVRELIPNTTDQDTFLINLIELNKQNINVPSKTEQYDFAHKQYQRRKHCLIFDLDKLRDNVKAYLGRYDSFKSLAELYKINPVIKYAYVQDTFSDKGTNYIKLMPIIQDTRILRGEPAIIGYPWSEMVNAEYIRKYSEH